MLLDGQIQMRFCAAAVFSASLPRHMAPFSAAWWHAHGLGVAQPHRRRVRPHPRVRAPEGVVVLRDRAVVEAEEGQPLVVGREV